MKLNDFQYNWYLHFEEENEKSIVGLPFDPYFEAHKYDSETILDYVPKARRKSKLGVLLLGIVSDCFDPIMEIPNCLKPFGSSTLKAIDEFCESVHRENWLLMVSWLAGVFSLFYLYGPIENAQGAAGVMLSIIGFSFVMSPVTILVGSPATIAIIFCLAALRYLVDIMPHAYTFMFTALVMSASISSISEAAVDDESVSSSEVHHVFMPDDQPTAEQFCSLIEQSGRSWFYKYTVKDDDIYLVESHRNGKLEKPVQLNGDEWYEAVYIVKKLHSECVQNFK